MLRQKRRTFGDTTHRPRGSGREQKTKMRSARRDRTLHHSRVGVIKPLRQKFPGGRIFILFHFFFLLSFHRLREPSSQNSQIRAQILCERTYCASGLLFFRQLKLFTRRLFFFPPPPPSPPLFRVHCAAQDTGRL